MLVVYSAHGSPGASTTAVYLAAQWAASGTEVLLLEADPAGGSLSHSLGIQFTPGLASFVAAGLDVGGGNLIDHSQDVLFNNLHVMPSTSSPTGARQIVKWLEDRADEFRDVAEAGTAVIIDGGRIGADSASAELTARAAGVVVVARGDGSPTSLEHIGSLLTAEACGADVERCVVTVGDSPFSAEEWRERYDVKFCGAVREFAEVRGDLAAFLDRNKRKSKKWRLSLEEVAEALLPYAKPAKGGPRSRRAEAEPAEEPEPAAPSQPAEEPAPSPAAEEPAPVPAAAAGHPDAGDAHDPAGGEDLAEFPAAADPATAPDPALEPQHTSTVGEYGEAPPQPYQPPAPAAGHPAPTPGYPAYAPEAPPPYFESPPPPPEYAWYDAPLPVYDPQHPPHPPEPPWGGVPHEAPPGYGQHGAYAPTGAPGHPDQAYGAPQVHQPPPAPPAHPQQPQPGHPHPEQVPPEYAHPPQQYQQPDPHGQPPPPQQQPAPPAPPAPPQQAAEPQQPLHQPPHPAGRPAPPAPPAEPGIAPSGSFRDWAARLHGQAPPGTSTHGHGGVS